MAVIENALGAAAVVVSEPQALSAESAATAATAEAGPRRRRLVMANVAPHGVRWVVPRALFIDRRS